MNTRQPTAVITFPNGGNDTLDSAGTAVFDAIRRAAASTEESTKRALDMAHKTALQLRAADDRIAQLQAELQQARVRAQRAEQWLHKIGAEIEQRFGSGPTDRPRENSPATYAPKRPRPERLESDMADLLQSRSAIPA